MDPSVSVPREKPTRPADVAEPGPAEEPRILPQIPRVSCDRRTTDRPASSPVVSSDETAPASRARHAIGVRLDHLIAKRFRAPGGLMARRREVFRAPGTPWSGPPMTSGDLVRAPRLSHRQLLRSVMTHWRRVGASAVRVRAGGSRRHLSRLEKRGRLGDRPKATSSSFRTRHPWRGAQTKSLPTAVVPDTAGLKYGGETVKGSHRAVFRSS
jgi:hypothetical protein